MGLSDIFNDNCASEFGECNQVLTKRRKIRDFCPEITDEITKKASHFYDEIRFPNYNDVDDICALINRGNGHAFTKALNDEIGPGSAVLEAGCGTGQLSIFLARNQRQVIGIDISPGSLDLAEDFRSKSAIHNAWFFKMDIFDLKFKPDSFDFVISNGVLHHTKNPKEAFRNLVSVTAPGGYIVIGLYHKWGRLLTNIKQQIARAGLGQNIKFLDSKSREHASVSKRNAWIKDQFFNPHETSHTPAEVKSWFDEIGVNFVNLLPHYPLDGGLFSQRDFAKPVTVQELALALDPIQIYEGGFFVMVGRKC